MAILSGTLTTTSSATPITTAAPLTAQRYRLQVYSSSAVATIYPVAFPTGFAIPASVICDLGLMDLNAVQVGFSAGTFSYWADPA
jgi:hypothetical protein